MRKSENKERGKEGSKLRQERSSFVSLEDEKTWKDKKETKTRGGGRKKEKERKREREERENDQRRVEPRKRSESFSLSSKSLFAREKEEVLQREPKAHTYTKRETNNHDKVNETPKQ